MFYFALFSVTYLNYRLIYNVFFISHLNTCLLSFLSQTSCFVPFKFFFITFEFLDTCFRYHRIRIFSGSSLSYFNTIFFFGQRKFLYLPVFENFMLLHMRDVQVLRVSCLRTMFFWYVSVQFQFFNLCVYFCIRTLVVFYTFYVPLLLNETTLYDLRVSVTLSQKFRDYPLFV